MHMPSEAPLLQPLLHPLIRSYKSILTAQTPAEFLEPLYLDIVHLCDLACNDMVGDNWSGGKPTHSQQVQLQADVLARGLLALSQHMH